MLTKKKKNKKKFFLIEIYYLAWAKILLSSAPFCPEHVTLISRMRKPELRNSGVTNKKLKLCFFTASVRVYFLNQLSCNLSQGCIYLTQK